MSLTFIVTTKLVVCNRLVAAADVAADADADDDDDDDLGDCCENGNGCCCYYFGAGDGLLWFGQLGFCARHRCTCYKPIRLPIP